MQRFILVFLLLAGQLFPGTRGSSAPLVTGDTFRAYSQHIFDETKKKFHPKKVKPRDIIFVKADEEYLGKFLSKYHRKIASPYILVTHNSDAGVPGKFARYLDDRKILAWYGQNVDGVIHPKLHAIPIGIANRYWEHGNPKIFTDFLNLQEHERPFLCYLNFATANNPKERDHVFHLFQEKFWIVKSAPKPLTLYLEDLKSSKFVLSPRGNGLDCHRTWEALLMGTIPIVLSSALDPLFTDLPVLIIDDWIQVTEEFLLEQYDIIKQKKHNLDKLFFDYWINKIREMK